MNVLVGYNGRISLGHGSFYALGAYATAMMVVHAGVPYWLAVPLAGAVCLVAGALFDLPVPKLAPVQLRDAGRRFSRLSAHRTQAGTPPIPANIALQGSGPSRMTACGQDYQTADAPGRGPSTLRCSSRSLPHRVCQASNSRLNARMADALHQWMRQQRQKIPDGSVTVREIDYSLNHWEALTRLLDDGDLPIDNKWVDNRIRPIALGRQNWLFAGSLRVGKRVAAVMSLIRSTRLNGLDPYAYMRGILERLAARRGCVLT